MCYMLHILKVFHFAFPSIRCCCNAKEISLLLVLNDESFNGWKTNKKETLLLLLCHVFYHTQPTISLTYYVEVRKHFSLSSSDSLFSLCAFRYVCHRNICWCYCLRGKVDVSESVRQRKSFALHSLEPI